MRVSGLGFRDLGFGFSGFKTLNPLRGSIGCLVRDEEPIGCAKGLKGHPRAKVISCRGSPEDTGSARTKDAGSLRSYDVALSPKPETLNPNLIE